MKTQQTNKNIEQRNACSDSRTLSAANGEDTKIACAKTLLDRIDAAQTRIRNLQDDIALLQSAENKLDLMSQNFAKVRRLVIKKQNCKKSNRALAALNHDINNLLMTNMLIGENAEANGVYLFKDGSVRMKCGSGDELTLATSRIPEIAGIENNDIQAALASLDRAAGVINRQYERIAGLMQALRDKYRQLRCETTLLMNAQLLTQTD